MNIIAGIDVDAIPEALRNRPQWVTWKFELRGGKRTKVPYNPATGRRALAADGWENKRKKIRRPPGTAKQTWTAFSIALLKFRNPKNGYDGIGYVFAADDPYFGCDLDSVLQADETFIPAWPESLARKCASWPIMPPAEIVKALDTYAEISPSGRGLKLIGIGKLPSDGSRKDADDDGSGKKPAGIELYDRDRFFTITGRRFEETPPELRECNGSLTILHRSVFGDGKKTPKAPRRHTARRVEDKPSDGSMTAAEMELLEKAFGSKSGEKTKQLWEGNTAGYSSESEADLALASMLAFWFGPDADDVERVIRHSKLCRAKWDEHATYLRDTITKALECKTEFYGERDDNVVTNFEIVEIEDSVGEIKKVKVPLRMDAIMDEVSRLTDSWPRRVDQSLFVHDPQHGVSWMEKPPALFGYFHSRVGQVRWHMTTGSVSMGELFAELQRTATRYVSVESLPHEPPIPNHYYAVEPIPPGDGSTLRRLLARFAPATDIDGDLILSAFLTPMWGGPPGCRPCYVVTSDDGRGAGKSTLAEMIGLVYDGVLQFSHMEDIGTIKTRLLSPEALSRRVALIDNIKSNKFSWGELEGAITASTIGGHRMYVGEATRPNTLTWFLTLNGAALSTDMAQRSIIVKIRKPERSATWFEETQQLIEENQLAILGDIIGFLRRPITMQLSRFTRWATWERDILQRLPEPSDAQAVIVERQADVDVDGEEAVIIEEHFQEQLSRLGYDTKSDRVFLPSQIAARWFGWATNQQNIAVISAGRQINQMATEGRLHRIGISTGRSWGRGFLWTGENWSGMHTCTDVQDRIRDQQRKDA
jgi:primase-polymerase (primpol)-like protein